MQAPSLVDVLFEAVRKQILTGAIPGGAALTEMVITNQFSVARPTAKAAIERLVHEGLLHRATNKSARVPLLDVDDIRDIYYSRGFIEREVIGALADTRTMPAEALAAHRAFESLVDESDLTVLVEADINFHRSLTAALNSPRLLKLYNQMVGEIHLCMAQVQVHHLLHPALISQEHEAIIQAIIKGDRPTAVREIDNHLNRACVRLIGYLSN